MAGPTFGIFDHIEGIPGTPTHQLFQDRLDLVKMADQAGFAGYHLAEHHGSDLCLAPNQEILLAAASQITENIRLGPMVKLLPLHHPVRLLEDMCVLDQLSGGRVDFGVGRGVAPIEHHWFGSTWAESRERFEDTLDIMIDALAGGTIRSDNSKYHDFPPVPLATGPFQESIPFWYPGSPVTAGRHGMSLMWPGPIDPETHELYASTFEAHRGEAGRVDGPDSQPRVGCTMVLAIADNEDHAIDIARRGMDGLVRRAHNVHIHDHLVLPEDECDAALGPLRNIMAHIEDSIRGGAGTAPQILERFGSILGMGLTDYIVMQIPTGDMTFDEAKHTLDAFVTNVMPELETISV